MSNQYIELDKLVKSPLNVRKTGSTSADEELKASIHAHGLMQNLVITEGKKGKYHVIAGARRLEALKALQAEGKLPADHTVPCQLVTEEHAAEMSLAENVIRQAMHPADRFEAFSALIEQGQTAEQVATRFGTTVRQVENSMRLARIAPPLIQEYREEKLSFDALVAFAVVDDHERQISVYESLNDWQKKRPGDIRDLLTEQMVEAKDKLVKFVGLNTYLDAGGPIKRDLFGEEVYLENPELLNALVGEKLKLVEKELQAEGWAWIQVEVEQDWKVTQGCTRLEPEPVDAPQELTDLVAKLGADYEVADEAYMDDDGEDDAVSEGLDKRRDELEQQLDEAKEKLEAYARFDPAQIKLAGCYAYVRHSGALEIERGLVRRQDAKKLSATATDAGSGQLAEKPKGLSESLKRDLEVYRLGVAQAEIAKHPVIAFDLLVFKVASNILTMRSPSDGPAVSFNREFAHNAGKEARDFLKLQMEPVAEGLPKGWLEAGSVADQFLAFQQLSDHQKQAILAYCVAATLQPKLDKGGRPTAYDIALAQSGANVATYWRPTKDNFLSRITKDELLELGTKLVGGQKGKQWATTNANAKKGDIAGELQRVFNTDDLPGMTPEQVERVKNWLPKGMAFREAPEPTPTKAKKGKKAA